MRVTEARRRPDGDVEGLERAGDYVFGSVKDAGELHKCVWFLLPIHEGDTMYDRPTRGSGLHMVREPIWTITEQEDGSVSVDPSIASGRSDPEGEYWHGYLRAGNRWETL